MNKRKALLLLLSATVIVSLILLSASLSQVVFEGAKPFVVSFKKPRTSKTQPPLLKTELTYFGRGQWSL